MTLTHLSGSSSNVSNSLHPKSYKEGTIRSTAGINIDGNALCDSSRNLTLGSGNITTTGTISTNSLTSSSGLSITSGTNQDLTIDAQGTGRIMINTIQSQGVIFGVNSSANVTDQVIFASDANLTRNALCMGVVNNGSTFNPFIGAQIPSTSWQPLFIQQGSAGVVFGGSVLDAPSVYGAGTSYSCVFVGTSNIHSGNLHVGGNLFVDSSRNITCGTINGITLFSPALIAITYDTPPFNFYVAGAVINILGAVNHAIGMSSSGNEIFLPSLSAGPRYQVTISVPYYRDWETDRKSTRLNSSH